MDRFLAALTYFLVRIAKYLPHETWRPGQKLKLLLIGYNGKRNTGADLRVAAMAAQFRHLLGADNVEMGILTLDKASLAGYFPPDTRLIPFDPLFFLPVLKACLACHAGVLSEGSCLKSTFANSLTLLFIGCAGALERQGKPCIAFGSEVGAMDGWLYRAAQRFCAQTCFVARTQASLELLQQMGLAGSLGTDTAWIAPAAPAEWAADVLRAAGWDGRRPLVGLAAINPFWWPVKPRLWHYVLGKWRTAPHLHYTRWYFFSDSEERRRKFTDYLASIARAATYLLESYDAQPVIFGMEAVDRDASARLQAMLPVPAPIFGATEYDGYQLTALLRRMSLLITSRYHARVLSMPGGVPSLAVSMDERLRNLLTETGHLDDYYLEADDPHLADKLPAAAEQLWQARERVRADLLATLPGYLKMQADMGVAFRAFIAESFPAFPLPPAPEDWTGYLPEIRVLRAED